MAHHRGPSDTEILDGWIKDSPLTPQLKSWATRIDGAARTLPLFCSAHQFGCPAECHISGFQSVMNRAGDPPSLSALLAERYGLTQEGSEDLLRGLDAIRKPKSP